MAKAKRVRRQEPELKGYRFGRVKTQWIRKSVDIFKTGEEGKEKVIGQMFMHPDGKWNLDDNLLLEFGEIAEKSMLIDSKYELAKILEARLSLEEKQAKMRAGLREDGLTDEQIDKVFSRIHA